jgi:DNA replication protein DnaC
MASPSTTATTRQCPCGGAIEPVRYPGYLGLKEHIRWPPLCGSCMKKELMRRDREARRAYRRRRRGVMRQRLEDCLPPAYRGARLLKLRLGIRSRLLASRRGIYLWGSVGAGKTYAMSAMARHFICAGLECRRVTFSDLLLEVKASWRRKAGPDEWEVIDELRRADRLIIEDIATDEERGLGLRVMLEILDWRCEHELPTYFTSNRPPEDLATVFDERIASRIIGSCDVLQLTGCDRRVQVEGGSER